MVCYIKWWTASDFLRPTIENTSLKLTVNILLYFSMDVRHGPSLISLQQVFNGTYTRLLKALNMPIPMFPTNLCMVISHSSQSLSCGEGRSWQDIATAASRRWSPNCYSTWSPTRGNLGRGRPPQTYIDQLKDNTGLNNIQEIGTAMSDRVAWRSVIGRAQSMPRLK